MKNNFLIFVILILLIVFLFDKLKITKNQLKDSNKKLESILTRNQLYIKDLKNRNEELRIKNEEFKEYQNEIEKNVNDCLNSPIDNNIVILLQKQNI